MAQKTFCDRCDTLINKKGTGEFEMSKKYLKGKALEETKLVIGCTTKYGPASPRDLCLYCLIDEINKLDDRPKEAYVEYRDCDKEHVEDELAKATHGPS